VNCFATAFQIWFFGGLKAPPYGFFYGCGVVGGYLVCGVF